MASILNIQPQFKITSISFLSIQASKVTGQVASISPLPKSKPTTDFWV